MAALLLFGFALSLVSLTRGPSKEFRLGEKHYYGNGTEQDYSAAADWYRKAAAKGHAEAQSRLGNMYLEGEGLPRNAMRAAVWFRKAADQGHAKAQFSLGTMYSTGRGVPRDFVRAYAWWNVAAAQGHASSKRMRDRVETEMMYWQLREAQSLSQRLFR